MFRKFWLPLIIKSVFMTEFITGLSGPSKKAKAGALALGFANILGEGFTQSNKNEIDHLIDETVTVLNAEGVFKTTGEHAIIEDPEEREKEESEIKEKETEQEPEVVEWPLKHYTPEVYLDRWPNGQWAELARKLTEDSD